MLFTFPDEYGDVQVFGTGTVTAPLDSPDLVMERSHGYKHWLDFRIITRARKIDTPEGKRTVLQYTNCKYYLNNQQKNTYQLIKTLKRNERIVFFGREIQRIIETPDRQTKEHKEIWIEAVLFVDRINSELLPDADNAAFDQIKAAGQGFERISDFTDSTKAKNKKEYAF